MKKKMIFAGIIVGMLTIFFTQFHVGTFNYKNTLTNAKGTQYNVYEDKTGYKVLEPIQDKHKFVVKVISKYEYKNN